MKEPQEGIASKPWPSQYGHYQLPMGLYLILIRGSISHQHTSNVIWKKKSSEERWCDCRLNGMRNCISNGAADTWRSHWFTLISGWYAYICINALLTIFFLCTAFVISAKEEIRYLIAPNERWNRFQRRKNRKVRACLRACLLVFLLLMYKISTTLPRTTTTLFLQMVQILKKDHMWYSRSLTVKWMVVRRNLG